MDCPRAWDAAIEAAIIGFHATKESRKGSLSTGLVWRFIKTNPKVVVKETISVDGTGAEKKIVSRQTSFQDIIDFVDTDEFGILTVKKRISYMMKGLPWLRMEPGTEDRTGGVLFSSEPIARVS